MPKMKYGKYILYSTQTSPLHPPGSFPGTPLMNVTDKDIKGGFYFECAWFTGTISDNEVYKPHYHDFDEYIGMFGSNPEDWFNLCGEVELWLDDEKHIITKTCLVFVPKGLWHTPIIVRKLNRPMLFTSTAPVLEYTQHINHDPKWSHLKDPPGKKIILD